MHDESNLIFDLSSPSLYCIFLFSGLLLFIFGASPSTEFVAALFLEISRKMCIIDGRKHFFCIFHVAAYQKHRGQTYVHFSKKQKIFRNFVFCAFYTKNSQVLSFEKRGFTLEFQGHGISQVGANVQFQWTSKPLDEPPEVDLVDFYQKSSMPLVWVGQPVGILVLR